MDAIKNSMVNRIIEMDKELDGIKAVLIARAWAKYHHRIILVHKITELKETATTKVLTKIPEFLYVDWNVEVFFKPEIISVHFYSDNYNDDRTIFESLTWDEYFMTQEEFDKHIDETLRAKINTELEARRKHEQGQVKAQETVEREELARLKAKYEVR